MANFNTHLTFAAAASGMLSTLCLGAGLIDTGTALGLTAIGTIGGVLPDVDLKYAWPSRIIFTSLGSMLALLWMFSNPLELTVLEQWASGLLVFLLIRFPLWSLFHQLTVHRGAIHSLAMGILCGLLATVVSFHVAGASSDIAWLAGLFMLTGFLLHLTLDEIYSVDFMGHRVKRSFGSALKLFDHKRIVPSLIIMMLAFATAWATPPYQSLWQNLISRSTWSPLLERFAPEYLLSLLQTLGA